MNYSYPSLVFIPSPNSVPNSTYCFGPTQTYPIMPSNYSSSDSVFGNYFLPSSYIHPIPPFFEPDHIEICGDDRGEPKSTHKMKEVRDDF